MSKIGKGAGGKGDGKWVDRTAARERWFERAVAAADSWGGPRASASPRVTNDWADFF